MSFSGEFSAAAALLHLPFESEVSSFSELRDECYSWVPYPSMSSYRTSLLFEKDQAFAKVVVCLPFQLSLPNCVFHQRDSKVEFPLLVLTSFQFAFELILREDQKLICRCEMTLLAFSCQPIRE